MRLGLCSLIVIFLAWCSYQIIQLTEYFKENPLVNPEKCHLLKGIFGPEDIVNWKGIGLTASDDRIKLWYGGANRDVDKTPNGNMWAIHPSNLPEKVSFQLIFVQNFPYDVAFHPHGMSLHENTLYVINHAYGKGGERVEVFDISLEIENDIKKTVVIKYKYSLTYKDKFKEYYGSFNDLLALNEKEILITNWLSVPHTVIGPNMAGTFWLDLKRVFYMAFLERSYVHYCKVTENNELDCKELPQTVCGSSNGINFDGKDLVMVAKNTDKKVDLFRLVEVNGEKDLVFLRDIDIKYLIDNIDYDPKTNSFYVSLIGRLVDFLIEENEMKTKGKTEALPEVKTGIIQIQVKEKIEDMKPEIIYMQNELLGLSIGTKFDNYILLGGPFFDGISVCDL